MLSGGIEDTSGRNVLKILMESIYFNLSLP